METTLGIITTYRSKEILNTSNYRLESIFVQKILLASSILRNEGWALTQNFKN